MKTNLVEHGNEIVSIYNDMLEEIGFAERSVANLQGLWHFCSQCWLINATNKSVIFQKRSITKNIASGLFDVSASGHVKYGMNTIDTALKEVKEELGVIITKEQLFFGGRRIDLFQKDIFLSRIFADVFFVLGQYKLTDFKIDFKESDAIIEIPIEDGFNLFCDKKEKIYCTGFSYNGNMLEQHLFEIDKDMFIKRYDDYYLKVFIAAERLILGKKIAI